MHSASQAATGHGDRRGGRAHLTPFICVPAGTRAFALDLGVDRHDLVGALEAFTYGVERLAVGSVNGRMFLNNVSLWIYGEAVRQAAYRDEGAEHAPWRRRSGYSDEASQPPTSPRGRRGPRPPRSGRRRRLERSLRARSDAGAGHPAEARLGPPRRSLEATPQACSPAERGRRRPSWWTGPRRCTPESAAKRSTSARRSISPSCPRRSAYESPSPPGCLSIGSDFLTAQILASAPSQRPPLVGLSYEVDPDIAPSWASRMLRNGPWFRPNRRWSTVVVASISRSAPIIRTDASNERGALVHYVQLAVHPVSGRSRARRPAWT